MKLKKSTISAFALASILCLTSVGMVNAQGALEDVSTDTQVQCPNNNCQKAAPCKHGRRGIFMKSVEELQKNGTLSEKDVENIKEFRKKEKEEMKQRILQEKNSKIDEMVKEKVITQEQGTKLKEAVEKNMNSIKE